MSGKSSSGSSSSSSVTPSEQMWLELIVVAVAIYVWWSNGSMDSSVAADIAILVIVAISGYFAYQFYKSSAKSKAASDFYI